jgi:3-deoxy-7-phosphoheptulonate synthase
MPTAALIADTMTADLARAATTLAAALPPAPTVRAETAPPVPRGAHRPIPPPCALRERYPATARGERATREAREAVRRILRREDDRLLVVVGPCSIHDAEAALEYAERLSRLQAECAGRLLFVMRVYLEKPRTTVGWRGLLNDPRMDGSFDMAEGLRRSRELLAEITDRGVPTATEVLDIAAPAYFSDLVSFAAVGARTTESQPHRALASGLPLPVGFKNGTDGSIQTALDAMISARESHGYLAPGEDGGLCEICTPGNPDTLLILRGGKACGPNYDPASVADAEARLTRLGLPPAIMVDCSHANSGSDPLRQGAALEAVARQRAEGNRALVGVMLESHLHTGKQALTHGGVGLRYGVSVTDACLGWSETEDLLRTLAG